MKEAEAGMGVGVGDFMQVRSSEREMTFVIHRTENFPRPMLNVAGKQMK